MSDEDELIQFVNGLDNEVYLSQIRDICDSKDLTSEQKVFSINMIVQKAPRTKYDNKLETPLYIVSDDNSVLGIYHTRDEAIEASHKVTNDTRIEKVILKGNS